MSRRRIQREGPPVYEYWEYSCYLDTLLVILLKNLSKKWFHEFIEKRYEISDFQPLLCGSQKYNIDQVVEYAGMLRQYLVNDYNILLNPKAENLKCTDIRKLLARCVPDMMERGRYVTHNPSIIYSLLCDVFPGCKITALYNLYKDGISYKRDYEKIAFFDVWDYMGDHSNEEGNSKEYLWDQLESDILIFVNNSTPVILDFGKIGLERSTIRSGGNVYDEIISKKRAFAESIIDDKYRLTGVIILKGYVPGREDTGSHYVGYFVADDQHYYYYDNLDPRLIPLDRYPENIWKYSNNNIPQMFFYARVG